MKNLIIVGTSGVGKTFLESELDKRGLYTQIPIYSDRLPRISEDHKSIVCLSHKNFEKNRGNFSFCLEYCGHNYGWKESDLNKKLAVVDISFKDLERFLVKYSKFLPLMMDVGEDKLSFLRERMMKRGDSSENIEKRIELTKIELKNRERYRKIVNKYNGLIFQIRDDKTIFEEVIPELMKIRENQ